MKAANKFKNKKGMSFGWLATLVILLLLFGVLSFIYFADMFPAVYNSIAEILGKGEKLKYAAVAEPPLEELKEELAESYVGKDFSITVKIEGKYYRWWIGGTFEKEIAFGKGEIPSGVQRFNLLGEKITEITKIEVFLDKGERIEGKIGIGKGYIDNPKKDDVIIVISPRYDKETDKYDYKDTKAVLELIYYGLNENEGYIEYEIRPYFDEE